jgi:hypothetical protein
MVHVSVRGRRLVKERGQAMTVPSPGELVEDRDRVLSYIADMTKELGSLARRQGYEPLGYLLDMARLEAENAASRPETAQPKSKVANG